MFISSCSTSATTPACPDPVCKPVSNDSNSNSNNNNNTKRTIYASI